MVQVGQVQKLIWKNVDLGPGDGPIYLTKEERLEQRDDKWIPIPLKKGQTMNVSKPITRAVLIDAILKEDKRFGTMLGGRSVLEEKSLKELQNDRKIMEIETETISTRRLRSSYVGKGKGMLQVLWERGFVDVKRMKDHKGMAKDEVTKMKIPKFSFLTMLKSQPDFTNKVS